MSALGPEASESGHSAHAPVADHLEIDIAFQLT